MNKAAKIRTVYDAGQYRRDETAEAIGRALEAQSKLNIERSKLALYPEIGILNRKGNTIFYAFPDGPRGRYFESADIDAVSREVSSVPRIVRSPVPLTREEIARQKRDHEEQIHQFREGDEK